MNLFELLFGFRGRINRAKYWSAVLIWMAIWVIVAVAVIASNMSLAAMMLALIVLIPSIVSGVAVGIKRLHDRDKTGWWILLFYVAPGLLDGIGQGTGMRLIFSVASVAITIWALVELGFLRGTPGKNQYGPDPLG